MKHPDCFMSISTFALAGTKMVLGIWNNLELNWEPLSEAPVVFTRYRQRQK